MNQDRSPPRRLTRSLSLMAEEILEDFSPSTNNETKTTTSTEDMTEDELLEWAIKLSLENYEEQQSEQKQEQEHLKETKTEPRTLVRSQISIDDTETVPPFLPTASETPIIPSNTLIYSWSSSSSTPTRITKFDPVPIVDITGNATCTLALTATGNVYAYGTVDDENQTLLGSKLTAIPRLIESLQHIRVVQIAVGTSHTACLTSTATVVTFGSNEYGELGHGDATIGHTNSKMNKITFVKNEKEGEGEGTQHQIRKVTCGRGFTVVLTTMGEVFACGRSTYGVLGNGNNNQHQSKMIQVVGLAALPIADISSGKDHTIITTIR